LKKANQKSLRTLGFHATKPFTWHKPLKNKRKIFAVAPMMDWAGFALV